MKIAITGGSGYWGSALIRVMSGHEISVLDMNPPYFEVNAFFKGTVTDRSILKDALRGADAVVHMAAIAGVSVCEENPELSRKVNVEGTRAVVEEMPDEAFLIFISSSAVYGDMKGIIREDTEANPKNTYGRHKLEAENIVRESGIRHAILRPSNLYGASPLIPLKYAVHRMVGDAVDKGKIHISDWNLMRNFIHVKDASKAIEHILEMDEECLCNLGDVDINLGKMAEIVKRTVTKVHGKDISIDVEKYSEEIRFEYSWKALGETGFMPKIPLEKGIEDIVERMVPEK